MKKIKNLIFVSLFTFVSLGLAFANASPTVLDKVSNSNANIKKEVENRVSSSVKSGESKEDCLIRLNTDFPFIGRCIGANADGINQTNVFAYMVKGLMKFIISVIMIVSLLMIVAAGVMMTTGGFEKGNYSKGKDWIKTVAIALALLGASGVILKLINPNFFL